ncbi:MAG: hypothetical protein ACTHJQ_27255 [Rhizobiaceae bacterium]
MRLAEDWRVVLRHAWSIRLIVVAGVLSGIEAVLPLIGTFPVSETIQIAIAIATPIVVAAAFVARLVAQEKVK